MTAFPKLVLVVDDEPAVAGVIQSQLQADEYAAITAKSGEEALEVVQNTKLVTVLLDLGLSGMTGFEVLQKIKLMKPSLPVIIVTGCHDEAEARKAFELGAWDYVTKPIDFNYLKNVLLLQTSAQ